MGGKNPTNRREVLKGVGAVVTASSGVSKLPIDAEANRIKDPESSGLNMAKLLSNKAPQDILKKVAKNNSFKSDDLWSLGASIEKLDLNIGEDIYLSVIKVPTYAGTLNVITQSTEVNAETNEEMDILSAILDLSELPSNSLGEYIFSNISADESSFPHIISRGEGAKALIDGPELPDEKPDIDAEDVFGVESGDSVRYVIRDEEKDIYFDQDLNQLTTDRRILDHDDDPPENCEKQSAMCLQDLISIEGACKDGVSACRYASKTPYGVHACAAALLVFCGTSVALAAVSGSCAKVVDCTAHWASQYSDVPHEGHSREAIERCGLNFFGLCEDVMEISIDI